MRVGKEEGEGRGRQRERERGGEERGYRERLLHTICVMRMNPRE